MVPKTEPDFKNLQNLLTLWYQRQNLLKSLVQAAKSSRGARLKLPPARALQEVRERLQKCGSRMMRLQYNMQVLQIVLRNRHYVQATKKMPTFFGWTMQTECMYVYVYTYLFIYTYTYIYVYIYTHAYLCMRTCVRVLTP